MSPERPSVTERFPLPPPASAIPAFTGLHVTIAFVTKFDPAGSTLLYSTFLGPNNNANPQAIALDANNDAYVLASTSSSSFSTVNGIETYSNGNDLLLVEIDPAGQHASCLPLTWAEAAMSTPLAIALDASGNLYMAGSTDSTDLPGDAGSFPERAGRRH